MVILLWDNEMIPFIVELYSSYPVSSRMTITGKERMNDVLSRVAKPPLFSNGWLIECNSKVKDTFVKKLNSVKDNKIVIHLKGAEAIQDKLTELADLEPVVVDNHLVSREDAIMWITEELECSTNIAVKVYERAGKRTSNVITGVQRLKMLPVVTENDVTKFVDRSKNISVRDVVEYLLGTQRRGVNQNSILDFIYDFRYAQKWLLTEISKELNLYLRVLHLAASGVLNLKNFKEYLEVTDDKYLQKCSEFQIKKILECFGLVSVEYVFFVKCKIDSISKTEMLDLLTLIKLVKIGGK